MSRHPLRVLLLSYYYPPAPEVGGVRPARLAQFLADRGHEVHVLTLARSPDEAGTVRISERLSVHRVQAWRSPRGMVRSLGEGAPARNGDGGVGSVAAGSPARAGRLRQLRSAVLSALWIPDDKQGFIGAAVSYGAELIARHSIDVVYMTGPPWSVHVAGGLLARFGRRTLVAEYRDPWSPRLEAADLNHPAAVGMKRWLQERSLRRADVVVTVTDGIADYVRRFASTPLPFITALNGMARLGSAVPAAPRSGPLQIVHAGEIYYGRDPGPFLQAVAAVARRRQLGAEDLRIEFLGKGRFYRGVSIAGLAEDLGIGSIVSFRDQVPVDECRQILAEADALLLLAQRQPMQVPNKLYDYLAAARPILAFVDGDGESERILRRLAGHEVVTDWTGPGAEAAVAALLDSARTRRLDPRAPALAELLSERQFARLADRIEAAVESREQ
ncbi:MAG: glycosyltransferase [Gemmatimonadales bacterium]